MSDEGVDAPTATAPDEVPSVARTSRDRRPTRTGLTRWLGVRRIGAVYVWIVAIVVFSVLSPHAFPTVQTIQAMSAQYSVTGMAALSIVVALATATFDLSVGANIGFCSMIFALLMGRTGMPVGLGFLITVGAGLTVSGLNVVVVVGLGVDSFIGTLATGAIVTAVTEAVSGGEIITARSGFGWTGFASHTLLGLSLPFYYLIAFCLIIAYWLGRTKSGRYIYAIGFDSETARLTGLPVKRLRTMALLLVGVIAGVSGAIITAQLDSASPDAGTAYLIPAFSAAFLGATQIIPGRFNPWGTLVAVFLLATGDFGIVTAGGPTWATSLFEGVVLLTAISLGGLRRGAKRSSSTTGANTMPP